MANLSTSKAEIILILYNLFWKMKAEEILPNSICKASIALIPKPDKDITEKENTDQYRS